MAFDVITIKEDFIRYNEISAGTLFSLVADTNTFYLKLADYEIEDECEYYYATNVFFYCSDSCVNIETGIIKTFKPTTECIIHSKTLKPTRK